MKLKHIEISGFRGFATREQFNLDADAIVVVGSNGLGKTSLLDAIHWGLCGKLGRLGGGDEKVVSIYSETGMARVSLTFGGDRHDINITRAFDGESQSVQLRMGDDEYKGTSARARLLETLWPEAAAAKDGDESLSSTLIRSVYLQQDRLREFLEGETDQGRFNVISELVGAGRLTELQSQLESESRSWSRATTRMNKEVEPLSERVEELDSQLAKLRHSANVGKELEESQWTTWWELCRQLEVPITTIPTPTSAEASPSLDRALREIQALRDRNKRRRSLAELTLEAHRNVPKPPEEAIEELEKRYNSAQEAAKRARDAVKEGQERAAELRKRQIASREADEQQRALAQLALQLLSEKCPVCQQDYDIQETRLRLEALVSSGKGLADQSEASEVNIDELATNEKETNALEAKAKRELADANRLNKECEQWRKEINDKLTELGVSTSNNIEQVLEDILVSCDATENRLKSCADDGELLSLSLARESANARIKSIEAELEKSKQELAKQRLLLLGREKTSAKTKLLIEELRDARSKVAVDKLREIEPLLQRIFARIDPHPTFRVVKFATDVVRGKGRLDAEIHDATEEKSSNTPEAIFSSSQLNALAVSVFLSFNLALPHLPLKSAILDDPIQSLDDINLLGLVDLLRRTKEKRQIIVSTHDEKFGRLLARKLRPANHSQRTSVIELRGWQRSGPEVNQYSVEADIEPLRLAAV